MSTVERVNEQISNIVEWNNNLKKCRNDINKMIKSHQSMSKQREVRIREMAQKTYQNSSYCDVGYVEYYKNILMIKQNY